MTGEVFQYVRVAAKLLRTVHEERELWTMPLILSSGPTYFDVAECCTGSAVS
jgi:hypothetical protein